MAIFATKKEVPWSKALSEKGLDEKGLVKKHFYSLETLKHLFDITGESFPKELESYLRDNSIPNDGTETEVYIKNKHIDLKAKDAGRADMLITFQVKGPKGSEPETHAIWIETQDQSGEWDSVHHRQWWTKYKSLKAQYDKVTAFMIASSFPKGYIDEFNNWQDIFPTHAVEFKIYEDAGSNLKLRTDSKQEYSGGIDGISQIQIDRFNLHESLKSSFKGSNVTIEGSESDVRQGYVHLRVDGQKPGYYFRHQQDSLGIGFQGDSNPSRMVKSTYDIVRSNPNEVVKQVNACSGLKLKDITKKNKKDIIIGSTQLRGIEDAVKLIQAFVRCMPSVLEPDPETTIN